MRNNLNHAFLFDSWRWSEHRELQTLYTRIWDELPKENCKAKTIESLRHHLKLFLCNLYVSYYYRKPVAIWVKSIQFSHGRYKALHLKRVPFMKIYAHLKTAGWIEHQTGYLPFSREDKGRIFTGSVTRIWPSEKLEAEFSHWKDFLPEQTEQECIVLRNEKKEDIPFEETAFTRQLKNELDSINRVFSSHYFSFDSSDVFTNLLINPFYIDNSSNSQSLSLSNSINTPLLTPSNCISSLREPNAVFRRFLPRIKAVFSNGDFACGGRLYSAGISDWQAMPQMQRSTIRIDNCRTVELDFNAFHISILYALEGRQITEDPYNAVAPRQMRPVVKKLLLTVLNASSIKEAIASMRHQLFVLRNKPVLKERDLKFLRACCLYRPDWLTLINRLGEAHPLIEKYFCSGAGIYLQRIDSEIMRNVLLNLAARNIPCLPVHDSAIVPYFREYDLRRAMDNAYRKKFPGFYCGIESK